MVVGYQLGALQVAEDGLRGPPGRVQADQDVLQVGLQYDAVREIQLQHRQRDRRHVRRALNVMAVVVGVPHARQLVGRRDLLRIDDRREVVADDEIVEPASAENRTLGAFLVPLDRDLGLATLKHAILLGEAPAEAGRALVIRPARDGKAFQFRVSVRAAAGSFGSRAVPSTYSTLRKPCCFTVSAANSSMRG